MAPFKTRQCAYCAEVRQVSSREVRSQTLTMPSPDPEATELNELVFYSQLSVILRTASQRLYRTYLAHAIDTLDVASPQLSKEGLSEHALELDRVERSLAVHVVRTCYHQLLLRSTTYYSRALSKGCISGARLRGARWTSEPGVC